MKIDFCYITNDSSGLTIEPVPLPRLFETYQGSLNLMTATNEQLLTEGLGRYKHVALPASIPEGHKYVITGYQQDSDGVYFRTYDVVPS